MKKVNGVIAFKVKGAEGKEGVWLVDVKNGCGSVKFGSTGKYLLVHVYHGIKCLLMLSFLV